MAEIRVLVNGNEYTEDQFRKDLIRMLDVYRDKDAQMGVPECYGVSCDVCPLCKNSCCERRTTNSFKTIGFVYEWALKHPAVTNRDKMIETFGGAYFNLIINYISDRSLEDYDNWLHEEYKEPKGENKNDD